jgi:hypothetical protein
VNYAELSANIQEVIEQSFTPAQIALFVQQSEQKLYNIVDLPAMRKNQSGSATLGNKYLTMPSKFLYAYSLAVELPDGSFEYLINKDVNFIREAYPSPADTGLPQYYAVFDEDTFILGPTPNANYMMELHFGAYPESIVTAGTTFLGEEFDSALLNGALVEAARFIKVDQPQMQMYDGMFAQSVSLLKTLSDGKLRQDMYRSGQTRIRVG